mmetsp:Transcript_3830/g.6720  ORF Transcript_3830/g.6720 Transcript_3830/m.6720 type:complete len:387 (+) Transcript_3830:114-1274(+)
MSDDENSKEDLFGSDSEDDQLQDDPLPVKLEKEKPRREAIEDLFEGNGAYRRDESDGEKETVKKESLGPPLVIQTRWKSVPKQDETYLLKLTKAIGVQPNDFNPEVFKDDNDYDFDEQGNRRLRPSEQAVVRWRLRKGPHGEEISESNAKFIRWSDGSLQLKLGDEYLDVIKTDITNNNAYLFADHTDISQGQAHLTQRMTLRPVSISSSLHQSFMSRAGQNEAAFRKVANTASLYDTDTEKEERRKAEAREMDALQRRQAREAEKYSRPYGGARPAYSAASSRGSGHHQQLNSQFLEADQDGYEEEDAELDRKRKRSKENRSRSSSSRSGSKRSRRNDEEDEEDEEDEDEEEDDKEGEGEKEERDLDGDLDLDVEEAREGNAEDI